MCALTTMHTDNRGKTVYIALSGGVDSATAALLLQREGYKVVGVYMKTWSPPGQPCPWKEDKRDAMRICAHLDIPFKMWDFTDAYKERVVNYMTAEYTAGRTPNPDVMCNKEIKFGLFFDKALNEGADYVATGHHARITPTHLQPTTYNLERGADPNKDQSYFLWTLTQRELSRTLMPVGEYADKKEVRDLATKAGIPVAAKKDSQGVCFIGPIDMQEFLADHISAEPGPIKSVTGRTLGTHRGLPFYTIGQREGVGVGGGAGPYYVARKEATTNTLVVAPPAHEKELMSTTLTAKNVNWINGAPKNSKKYDVQIRYRQTPFKATFKNNRLYFAEPVRAVTPGQSVVLYEGNTTIGGGIIAE